MNAGDFTLGSTFDVKFTTIDSTGLGSTLGSGTVAAYPDNSITQITAGITLSADFDGLTGLNNVRVVATSGNGYAAGTNYVLVLTAGTVDSVSVVGYVIAHFSLDNRSVAAVKTDTAAILVDTAEIGAAGAGLTEAGGTGDQLTALATAANLATVDTNVDAILVDTGTTLQAELDAIQAAVITNAAGVDIAADIIALKAVADAVLVDTGTTLQAEVDAIQAAVITNAAGVDIAADIIALKAETAAILADTDVIGAAGAGLTALATAANLTTVDTVVDAIKLQTDKFVFTVANQVDANVQYINDTAVAGDGGATPWGPA